MLAEWDPLLHQVIDSEARLNLRNHGVSFADAVARRSPAPDLGSEGCGANDGNMRMQMKCEYDSSKAKRGPVISVQKGKTRITIRLDEDVIRWFRTQGEKQVAATTKA